jgi:hypothetical protein
MVGNGQSISNFGSSQRMSLATFRMVAGCHPVVDLGVIHQRSIDLCNTFGSEQAVSVGGTEFEADPTALCRRHLMHVEQDIADCSRRAAHDLGFGIRRRLVVQAAYCAVPDVLCDAGRKLGLREDHDGKPPAMTCGSGTGTTKQPPART